MLTLPRNTEYCIFTSSHLYGYYCRKNSILVFSVATVHPGFCFRWFHLHEITTLSLETTFLKSCVSHSASEWIILSNCKNILLLYFHPLVGANLCHYLDSTVLVLAFNIGKAVFVSHSCKIRTLSVQSNLDIL